MEENNKKWENVEHQLASELISGSVRQAKAKDFAIWCLTVAIVIIGIGMSAINYKNDCDWRELFSSYDYVSQDGNGQNYYNADVGGDVLNGATSTETEEQK